MHNRKWLVITINILIFIIVLCSYKKNPSSKVITPDETSAFDSGDIEKEQVNITYDSDIDSKYVTEVKNAVYQLPPAVIKGFAENDWKIVLVKDIDFTDSGYSNAGSDLETVGLTNYKNKTIQVKPLSYADIDNFVMLRSLHELCHYADIYYGNASEKEDWMKIYKKYAGKYIEYEFYGIKETSQNKEDIEYAGSDKYEMFASAMKDYLHSPDYTKEHYPDIYEYFTTLINTKEITK